MLFSMRCLLLGHDDWLVRSPERLRLRCDHCRRETTGWALTRIHASRLAKQVTEPSRIHRSRLERSSTPKRLGRRPSLDIAA
jgi:hypothetical protein